MKRVSYRRAGTTGFTLIELLVVIAIIAILAAILFPVFAQAREKARGASCVSNEKQIVTSILMYAQDYDEGLVPWYQLSGVPNDQYASWVVDWVQLLGPYVKNGAPVKPPAGYTGPINALGVFQCPSWTADKYRQGAGAAYCWGSPSAVTWVPGNWYHADYGVGFGGGAGGSCTTSSPHESWAGSTYNAMMPLAAINRPAETAEVSDGITVALNTGAWDMTMGCESAEMHTGGGNFAFVDGHVKWVARNAERYLDTDASGCVYKRYMSIDR